VNTANTDVSYPALTVPLTNVVRISWGRIAQKTRKAAVAGRP